MALLLFFAVIVLLQLLRQLFKKQLFKLATGACLLIIPIGASAQTGAGDSVKTAIPKIDSAAKTTLLPDSIISITNLSGRKDSARLNEILAIRIKTKLPIDSFKTLYIDDIKVGETAFWSSNDYEKIIYFKIDESVQNLAVQFLASKSIDKARIPVYLSVGYSGGYITKGLIKTQLEVKQKISRVWVWIIAVVMGGFLAMGFKNNILKDDSNLYYSLSRTQLLYWTVIFSLSYLYICNETGALPDIPGSLLAILGISAATMATGKVIENDQKTKTDIDPKAHSEGFFHDILSDRSSINIQRLQNVLFNVLFGLIFIQKTVSSNLLPDFDNNILLMMGISAGTYAGLKATEPTKDQPTEQHDSTTIGNERPADTSNGGDNKEGTDKTK
ncbi:hypothetical protein MTO98_23250 [Mucilaginibacter sp. SMC90]|uniref:hypothetical protein n=1 Tax=Mucilaginibacter sp. SMC90 TaxID=2929803 RepID=UPI001FB30341|nr:hypothetical protein [Mucilaginibacter sp. SMC90]UOE47327.1 hypothetical protein MTO98_23250 [Mucilaginibacter sp. SMC90]